jgi:L-fuconolactonase
MQKSTEAAEGAAVLFLLTELQRHTIFAVDADWSEWMRAFAQRPNAYCKLSGMVTEVGEAWSLDNFRAHADFVLDAFGPKRVMFGSDWPVCLKVATHSQVVQLAEALTSHLIPADRDAVWGGTAAHFYGV